MKRKALQLQVRTLKKLPSGITSELVCFIGKMHSVQDQYSLVKCGASIESVLARNITKVIFHHSPLPLSPLPFFKSCTHDAIKSIKEGQQLLLNQLLINQKGGKKKYVCDHTKASDFLSSINSRYEFHILTDYFSPQSQYLLHLSMQHAFESHPPKFRGFTTEKFCWKDFCLFVCFVFILFSCLLLVCFLSLSPYIMFLVHNILNGPQSCRQSYVFSKKNHMEFFSLSFWKKKNKKNPLYLLSIRYRSMKDKDVNQSQHRSC